MTKKNITADAGENFNFMTKIFTGSNFATKKRGLMTLVGQLFHESEKKINVSLSDASNGPKQCKSLHPNTQ